MTCRSQAPGDSCDFAAGLPTRGYRAPVFIRDLSMNSGENERRIRERKRTWWTQVLAGPVDDTYPAPGAQVIARLEGETLVISGTVATEQDRREIEEDVNSLIGNGIAEARIELEIASDSTEERGLLSQTLVGLFESEDQARFAASYLSSQEDLH